MVGIFFSSLMFGISGLGSDSWTSSHWITTLFLCECTCNWWVALWVCSAIIFRLDTKGEWIGERTGLESVDVGVLSGLNFGRMRWFSIKNEVSLSPMHELSPWMYGWKYCVFSLKVTQGIKFFFGGWEHWYPF